MPHSLLHARDEYIMKRCLGNHHLIFGILNLDDPLELPS